MGRRFITHRRPQETLLNPVQDIAELRLVAVSDVDDKSLILVEDTGTIFRYDYDSSAADNGTTIIEPTAGVGRFIDTTSAGASPTDHNTLTSLQGGTAGEYYHLTADEHTMVETGHADGGFRLKWSQEQIYAAGDTGEIGTDEELIITEITIDGSLTVDGTLLITGTQTLDYYIELVDARDGTAVAGTWATSWESSTKTFQQQRAAGVGIGEMIIDGHPPSSDVNNRASVTGAIVYYTIGGDTANDVTADFYEFSAQSEDTVGAGAKPSTAVIPASISSSNHNTPTKRGAINGHALEYTFDSPVVLNGRQCIRVHASFDCKANTIVQFRGAMLLYNYVTWP